MKFLASQLTLQICYIQTDILHIHGVICGGVNNFMECKQHLLSAAHLRAYTVLQQYSTVQTHTYAHKASTFAWRCEEIEFQKHALFSGNKILQ